MNIKTTFTKTFFKAALPVITFLPSDQFFLTAEDLIPAAATTTAKLATVIATAAEEGTHKKAVVLLADQ